MQDILIVSEDIPFSRMLTLELQSLHRTVSVVPNLSLSELTDAVLSQTPYKLLILDLDVTYVGLEKILNLASEKKLPAILFGYPDSDAMTPQKQRLYNSDIYHYVFPRPFLLNQFLYCAKELLHYKETVLPETTGSVPMQMKQYSAADDLLINRDAHTVTYKNNPIALTKTEYTLLSCLMEQRGTVLTRGELYRAVWKAPEENDSASNVVDVYIRYIRKKLDDAYHVRIIETVRGVGYVIRKN